MIGYSTMAETLIWVQTTEPATVAIEYWDVSDPDRLFRTDPVTTEKKTACVAKCIADQVSAGSEYAYRVRIDGNVETPMFRDGYKRKGAIPLTFHTPPNWRFRENGHAIFDFEVGFGSCAYINQDGGYDRLNGPPYGGEYRIFESIYEVKPDVFIWLGDNVYLREPDWTSRTGIYQRWTHDRSTPELRAMLATIPNYATWDDHDYGPNNSGWEFWNKEMTTEAFKLFHGNASAGLPELPGIFTFFNWGDVNFYLVDNRTYRTPDSVDSTELGCPKSMLGKRQVDWLVDTMKYHQGQSSPRSSYPSNFNIVCIGNQVLSPYSEDNLPNYEEEWEYLFSRIMHEGINGVVFLSGDVHFSEVSKLVLTGGGEAVIGKTGVKGASYPFFDITSSPMTSGSWPGATPEQNPNRYDIFPGDADRVGQRNFATLRFVGPLEDRTMTICFYDSDGNLINQKPGAEAGVTTDASVIRAKDLVAPAE